jgi:methyl-accepting chemotaxis protein
MVTENSGSIEQITENTGLISHQTNEVSGVSKQLYGIAVDGKEMIENTLKGMREIEDSSRQIDQINQIINDIADRTKILAINAAIESTNTGNGKNGFTVIAGEMRKLAEKTNDNAFNIRSLVEDILSRISRTLNLSEESRKLFYTIHDLADHIRSSNDRISVAMNDEAGKLGMIFSNTTKLVDITGRINALSGELQQTSSDIKETFSRFSIMVGEEGDIIAKHSDVIKDLVGKMEIIITENRGITEKLNDMIGKIKIN